MSDTDESVTDDSNELDAVDVTSDETSSETDQQDTVDHDAGAKKALQAERQARKAAERELPALRTEIANRDKPAEEIAIEQARREAREEARNAYNKRIVSAELKAALTGKVTNPALALKVADISAIEVSDGGEVDMQSVTDVIQALITEYPELSTGVPRPRIPDVPADPATKPSTPPTLEEKIAAAQTAGNVAEVIALQNQRLQ